MSIIAFKAGEDLADYRFHVTASHSDSQTFKLKENAEADSGRKEGADSTFLFN